MSSVCVPAVARHLCDVSFRPGPPENEPVAPPSPPLEDAWSLDAVLGALANGAGVFESRTGLRLRHAHLRPQLAEALPLFAEEVRAWMELGLTNRPVDTALRGWPHRVRLYVAWLDAVLLPSGLDIEVRPGERVANPEAFRASIQGRLWAGPTSASALTVMADLASLFNRYAALCARAESPARPVRRAA